MTREKEKRDREKREKAKRKREKRGREKRKGKTSVYNQKADIMKYILDSKGGFKGRRKERQLRRAEPKAP